MSRGWWWRYFLYPYSKGIQSSREIQRLSREDVAFMVITV